MIKAWLHAALWLPAVAAVSVTEEAASEADLERVVQAGTPHITITSDFATDRGHALSNKEILSLRGTCHLESEGRWCRLVLRDTIQVDHNLWLDSLHLVSPKSGAPALSVSRFSSQLWMTNVTINGEGSRNATGIDLKGQLFAENCTFLQLNPQQPHRGAAVHLGTSAATSTLHQCIFSGNNLLDAPAGAAAMHVARGSGLLLSQTTFRQCISAAADAAQQGGPAGAGGRNVLRPCVATQKAPADLSAQLQLGGPEADAQVFSEAPLEYAVFGDGAAVLEWLPAVSEWTPQSGGSLQFLTGQEAAYTDVRQEAVAALERQAYEEPAAENGETPVSSDSKFSEIGASDVDAAKRNSSSGARTAAIIGGFSALVILLAAIAMMLLFRRRYRRKTATKAAGSTRGTDAVAVLPENRRSGGEYSSKQGWRSERPLLKASPHPLDLEGSKMRLIRRPENLRGIVCAASPLEVNTHWSTTIDFDKPLPSAAESTANSKVEFLHAQLSSIGRDAVLLERFVLLGPNRMRQGGQGVVAFAKGVHDDLSYALKFFVERECFLAERDMYRSTTLGRLLPQVHAEYDPEDTPGCAILRDRVGRPLPPCIVMERGEGLPDWSKRAKPDVFQSVAVLANVATRLRDMHESGYVHRDVKPENLMFLPRENRWTIIDFGCAAAVGQVSTLAYTLVYAAPEIAAAVAVGAKTIVADPAVDAWALGVVAFELLTGQSAFNLVIEGRDSVFGKLLGTEELAWEGELEGKNPAARRRLGLFREPVLSLLHRDPAQRATLATFCRIINTVFSSPTTVERA